MRKKLALLMASLFLIVGTAWAQTPVLKLMSGQIGNSYPLALSDADAEKVFALEDLTVAVKVNASTFAHNARMALFCTSDPTQDANTSAKGKDSHYVAYGLSGTSDNPAKGAVGYLASCITGDRFTKGGIVANSQEVVLVYVINPSNKTYKMYINGVENGSWVNAHTDGFMSGYEIATPKMVKADYTNAKIYLGGAVKANNQNFETFNGTITGVEVYSGALTAEQVKNVFLPVTGKVYQIKNLHDSYHVYDAGTALKPVAPANVDINNKSQLWVLGKSATAGKYTLRNAGTKGYMKPGGTWTTSKELTDLYIVENTLSGVTPYFNISSVADAAGHTNLHCWASTANAINYAGDGGGSKFAFVVTDVTVADLATLAITNDLNPLITEANTLKSNTALTGTTELTALTTALTTANGLTSSQDWDAVLASVDALTVAIQNANAYIEANPSGPALEATDLYALKSPSGTYFNFTKVLPEPGAAETYASFHETPSFVYKKSDANGDGFYLQSLEDENKYIGYQTTGTYWITTTQKSYWTISEEGGSVEFTRKQTVKGEEQTVRLGHDTNTNAGTGIFTNVGTDCNKWQLIPAYPITVIYKNNSNDEEIDRVKVGVFANGTYIVDTKNMPVLSCVTNKGEIVENGGVYSIQFVQGATEITVTLNVDKYAGSNPTITDDEIGTLQSYGQYLKALTLGNTSLLSGAAEPSSKNDMHVVITDKDVLVVPNQTYSFTLTFPKEQTNQALVAKVWMDKDGDGVYESLLSTTGTPKTYNNLTTVQFTVPQDATLGETRIRLRLDGAWAVSETADGATKRMVYDIAVKVVDEIVTKELTYNFMYNGQKIATQTFMGTVGVSFPVPTYQFKVANELLSFILPEGKVEEGTDTYNVEVRINNAKFPTPTTITDGQFANDTKWYFATLRNEYMQYNGSTEVVTTATHGLTDNDLFTVVGNPATGYHIYNKALGATKAIYSNTPNNLSSVLELNTAPNAGWSVTTNSNGGFSFYNTYNSANYYLHEKDNHLKHWSSESAKTDGGSNLIFEPAYEFTVLIGEVPGSVDAEAKYRGQTDLTNNGKLLLSRVDLDLFSAKDISGYSWKYIVDKEAKTITLAYSEVIPEVNPSAVQQLLARVGGWDAVKKFKFVLDPSINSKNETFVLGSEGDLILIKGSTISAITTGLGWYLNNVAHINIAWNSLNEKTVSGAPYADLSDLPLPASEETHTSDAKYRYYLNTCTFGYSMTSWTWKRWQQEIDWMALHGINMPLQLVGMEEVWRKFLINQGYSETDAKAFVAGPAFIAWWAMNNLEGWGGTAAGSKSGYNNLPGAGGVQDDAWYARQAKLAKQILEAQRALGMQPVLPGWSGMVPTNFASKSTGKYATRGNGGNWAGDFVRPLLLNVNIGADKYAAIAADYYACLKEVMGESQYYSMDPFHEGGGAGTMADYEALYAAMETAKPGSQWVIQQWQWSDTQKYSLTAVPAGKLVVLDLFSDGSPAFDSYNGYAPQDAVFCAIPNFGGRSGLMGRLQNVTDNYFKFKGKYASIKGIGTAPEAIEQTPVTYDLIYQLPWMNGVKPDVAAWVDNYAYARYGKNNSIVKEAWSLLRQGPLNYGADGIQGPVEDVWAARPNLSANPASFWGKTMNHAIGTYTKERHQMLIDAVYKLIDQEDELALTDGSVYKSNYLYDLVEFGGAVMADYAYYLLKGIADAKGSDDALYQARKNAFLQLILDMDDFRGTNLNFRLGKWTQEARAAAEEVTGATTATADWYEYNNARTILTTWSSPGTNLNDYSYRSWQGLLKDYYYKRWKYYFDNNCNGGQYEYFEWNWAHGKEHYVGQTGFSNVDLTADQDGHTSKYTRDAVGNTIEEANEMLGKYIIPVVKADGSVYYAYRYLTNDEMASKVTIMATAGDKLNLTEIFKTTLTGATVTGDFATMVTDNTFADFSNVVVKSEATIGSHAGVITLTDGTVLKFNVVLAKFNGVYQINYQDNGDKAVFVGYNSDKDHANNVGYKLIAQGTYAPSADLDKLFTVTPSGAGYTLSAQGKYLKAPNLGAWNHVMFSDNKADAGVYLFEETSLGSDIYKFRNPSNADDIKYINDYDNLVFGNDKAGKENLSTFTLTEVTSFPVTFSDTIATICFPFNVVMPAGVTAYDITSEKFTYGSGSSSAFAVLQRIATEGEVLKAGTPAIVKMTQGVYSFVIQMNPNGAKTSLDGSILKGNFVKETLATSEEHKKFVLEGADFTVITENKEMVANSCWIQTNIDVDKIVLSKSDADDGSNNIIMIDDWQFQYTVSENGSITLVNAVKSGSNTDLVIGSHYTINGKTQRVSAISPTFLHGNTDLESITLPKTMTNLGFRIIQPMFKGSYKGQAGDGGTYSGSTAQGEVVGKDREFVFPTNEETGVQYQVNGNFAWRLTLDVTIDPTKKTSFNNYGSAIVSSNPNSLADYYNNYMQIYLWEDLQHIVVKIDNNDDRYSYSLPELDAEGKETGNLVTLNHFKFELEHDGAGGYQVVIYYDDGRAKMYSISAGQSNLEAFSSLYYSLPEGIHVDVTFEELISQGLFVGCTNLKKIFVDRENPTFKSCEHGVLYDKNGYYVMRIPEGETSHHFEIPSKVVKLYAGAVYGVNADIVLHSNPQIGVVKGHEDDVKYAKFYLSLDDIDDTIEEGEKGYGGARDFTSANKNHYLKARYKRTPLAKDRMGTICLPFVPKNAMDKYDFFKLKSGNASSLTFTQVTELVANEPYLYRWKQNPVESTELADDGVFDNEEIGTLDVFETDEEFTVQTKDKYDPKSHKSGTREALGAFVNYYLDADQNTTGSSFYIYQSSTNKFHKVLKRLTYRPYRAFFVVTPEPNQQAQAPSRLNLELLDGTTTSIDASLVEGMEAPEYYDLSGRRVLNPVSGGIYIVNGQKVVLK